MSLPRLNVLVLSLSLGVSAALVGCSSNPSKVTDTGPKSSEQAYYEKAQQALERGQYSEAGEQLQALDTYFPTGRYNQQAQLDLMYTRFKQADYTAATTLAERFIRVYPQHPQVDYAYYVRGVSNMEQNYDGLIRYTSLKQAHRDTSYLKVAYANFADFIRRFPSSKYAVDAAQRMQYIGEELAESEMNIARYNLKRKAWVAAIQRGRWVLEYYPQVPQTPEAIATIAYAYDELGDQDTANQYKQLLQANYPGLINKDGEVNLRAARNQGSLLNKMTLGVLGRSANNNYATETNATQTVNTTAESDESKRSLMNRLSFGLIGDDGASATEATNTDIAEASDRIADASTTTADAVQDSTANDNTTNQTTADDGVEDSAVDASEETPAE
ncbi:Beta-barrel assembly machine subunit BamD [Acinetobacter marinus]|uniref:Outer membrane protein assembly factor BamD n=1 Tax=Acinetobacter marinus TaxID=281375 RepID=A0A1G6NCQ6_9GAMM|nr:outer membrane protein assembly factor BamD [Acinetobacter marinus]SDC65588.1 Beta-barrel assembly machine subunit BamD [Acinetobacter marinus]